MGRTQERVKETGVWIAAKLRFVQWLYPMGRWIWNFISVIWRELVSEAPAVTMLGVGFLGGWLLTPPKDHHSLGGGWGLVFLCVAIAGAVLWAVRAYRHSRGEDLTWNDVVPFLQKHGVTLTVEFGGLSGTESQVTKVAGGPGSSQDSGDESH
jgi:hypothetical protein